MLLAIDCGNSDTSFALVESTSNKHQIKTSWRVATASVLSSEAMDTKLKTGLAETGYNSVPSYNSVQGVIIANVVPDLQKPLETWAQQHFQVQPLQVHEARKQAGIIVHLDEANALGEDRLANAIGANARYRVPLVVVDFGSAVTFDCVDGTGAYLGGIIAPGINLSRQALHQGTAKLPQVDFADTQTILGKNTVAAMQSGLYWGYVGLVEGILTRLKTEFPYEQVIATGGQAQLVAKSLPMIDAVDDALTVYGLAELYARATEGR